MRRRLALLAIVMAVAVEGALYPGAGTAETPAASPGTEKDTPVIVFAATSTKTALDAVAAAWKTNTGKTASIAYASSGILAKQIEQGAPADIFISADLRWMDYYLQKATLIRAGTRRKLLGNKLVLIEPGDADVKLEITKGFDLAGAAGDGKIATRTLDSCPGGIYAKEAARIARSFREC
jgi:molybdate transport system substrate-binding protein